MIINLQMQNYVSPITCKLFHVANLAKTSGILQLLQFTIHVLDPDPHLQNNYALSAFISFVLNKSIYAKKQAYLTNKTRDIFSS